jgi:hypothetical protein
MTSFVFTSIDMVRTHQVLAKAMGTGATITILTHRRTFIMASLKTLVTWVRVFYFSSTSPTTTFLADFTIQEDSSSTNYQFAYSTVL